MNNATFLRKSYTLLRISVNPQRTILHSTTVAIFVGVQDVLERVLGVTPEMICCNMYGCLF